MAADEGLARGEVVITCANLDSALAFYTGQLGFRLEMIMPADAPQTALVSGHGISLRLERGSDVDTDAPAIRLRLPRVALAAATAASAHVIAPGNVLIELIDEQHPGLDIPPVAMPMIQRGEGAAEWTAGRAGMRYRDLIPGRVGGAVIASQIRIEQGGPVDDYVHFHRVGLQLIYCRRGWVRVVYEDQGPAFVMQPGDCVLQPPTIRHRVLESSAGLEVIEFGIPAVHETWRDHELALPTDSINPARDFEGQRFVRHIAEDAKWHTEAGDDAASCRDIGVSAATGGLASARVLRLHGSASLPARTTIETGEFCFLFALHGSMQIIGPGIEPIPIGLDDACVLPSNQRYSVASVRGAEVLMISTIPN